jgi:hypothetical protein
MFQGLSFIQAGFLAAGLAAAVPLMIHLLFRQRARRLTIGSVRFLHQVIREHRRRRRIRQWLLLAMRCLAVLLLALLFARPFMDAAFRRGLEEELVLLIDDSASMATSDSRGSTAFARALDTARSELAKVDENVVVHVAMFNASGVREVQLADLESADAVSHLGTDYGLATSWAGDVLATSRRTRQRVVLITDLQQSGLGKSTASPLPHRTVFDVVDIGTAVSRNLVVYSVDAVKTEIRPAESVTLRIVLRNFAPLPSEGIPLQLRLTGPDGESIAADRKVSLPGGITSLEIPLSIERGGVYQGHVRLECEDGSPWDNQRWIAFEARHPDRVLLIDGQEGRTVFGNETYYLETALRLPLDDSSAHRRSFEIERIVWESGQGFPDLTGFRAIVMANVRRLSVTDTERLQQYVRAGGSLLLLAGDQTNPADLDALRDKGVFPGTVVRRPVEAPRRLTGWNDQQAALATFADPQRGDLRRIQFFRSLPVETLHDEGQSLLQLGPYALAAERRCGEGRCIYFGSSADRDWTDWPQTRLYVPLLRQLLAYLTGQFGERAQVTQQIVQSAAHKAGIESVGEQIVVRNIDAQESIPDRVTVEQFCSTLGIVPAELEPEERMRRASLALPEDAQRPDEIWTDILWILLAALVVETFLASRVHA